MIDNAIKNHNGVVTKIINSSNIVIYGAGTMGRAVLKCLTGSPYDLSIKSFIVKSLDDNDDMVDGLPVVDIAHALEYRKSTVLIALNGKYISEASSDLTEAGFVDIVPISFDGDAWTALRGNWIRANNILPQNVKYLSDLAKDEGYQTINARIELDSLSERFHIYVVHSAFDRKLSKLPKNEPYEIDIQVGAALTDKLLFEVRDNIGDDCISEKNKQYCELTGIYWAWKNDETDYVGFSHYRRKYTITDEQMMRILTEDIDVVVTEPLLNYATVRWQYAKDHCADDWDVFMGVLREAAPEYYSYAEQVQNGIYYFAYNMFIMKKKIFRRYCEFVFPILKECERIIGIKDDVYQNRYVGFLAERLLTIFVERNNNLKVAVADKTFLEG